MIETWGLVRGRARGRTWPGVVLLAATALGIAPGCDSQVDPGYRGEPLLSVAGQVEAALSAGEVEVGILWLTASRDFAVECTGEAETVGGEPSAAPKRLH